MHGIKINRWALLFTKKQQKFYSLPKRYKQIRRFEQRPFRSGISVGGSGKARVFYTGHVLKSFIHFG